MGAAIPITVLGGYLGAGKTTLLNDVLAHADGRRIAVIVNDFGELGVDAALLGDVAGDGLVDLPNGCICCTLGADLGVALDALSSRPLPPEHIVIEASGVADPAALAAWGTVPGFAPGGTIVLAAADAVRSRSADRYVGDEVLRQLRSGDLVVVTKADLVSSERLDEVRAWLATTTDVPVVLPPDPPSDLVLVVGDRADGATRTVPRPASPAHENRYGRWSWFPPADGPAPSIDAARRFADALPAAVVRAKGLIPTRDDGVAELQVVGATRSVTPTSVRPSRPGLVAIGVGPGFDPAVLDTLAAAHLR